MSRNERAGFAMRCLMPALIATALPIEAEAADYAWPVVRVVDSDIVAADASADMPAELADLKVRVRGADTPETWKPKCDVERAAGTAATAFTKAAIASADIVIVRDPAWGEWGGCVVADLIVDGKSLAALLIEAGHGRGYDGEKRQSWCR